MKNDLITAMDALAPEDLDEALGTVTDVSAPEGVSEDRIREKVRAMTGQAPARTRAKMPTPAFFKKIVPLAACFVLLLGAAILLPMLGQGGSLTGQGDKDAGARGRFTLGVGTGIEFVLADDGTVKSIAAADPGNTVTEEMPIFPSIADSPMRSLDFSSMKGKDAGASVRGVLDLCKENGCLAPEDTVGLTFDASFGGEENGKADIVEAVEVFFYENGENPKIVVRQITEDADDPEVTEHIGLGNVKQIIAADLGYPDNLCNTLAEMTADEDGVMYYHLFINSDAVSYEYTVNAVTGQIVGKTENPL